MIKIFFVKGQFNVITPPIETESNGLTFEEVYNFFEFMKNIHDVDTAFGMDVNHRMFMYSPWCELRF